MRNYETKIYDYIDKKTGAHVVKATTIYDGKNVSAYSKCDPADEFNLEFGTQVALKRLDLKIARKRYVSMVAYAKFCRMNLEFIEIEKRRTKKALERAEIAALDRKLDIKKFETELAEIFNKIS